MNRRGGRTRHRPTPDSSGGCERPARDLAGSARRRADRAGTRWRCRGTRPRRRRARAPAGRSARRIRARREHRATVAAQGDALAGERLAGALATMMVTSTASPADTTSSRMHAPSARSSNCSVASSRARAHGDARATATSTRSAIGATRCRSTSSRRRGACSSTTTVGERRTRWRGRPARGDARQQRGRHGLQRRRVEPPP